LPLPSDITGDVAFDLHEYFITVIAASLFAPWSYHYRVITPPTCHCFAATPAALFTFAAFDTLMRL